MTTLGAQVRLIVGGIAVSAADAVTSVFGRTGAVVAQLGDYAASLITNDSGVAGATVKAALDALAASIAALSGVYAPIRLTVKSEAASRALVASDNNALLVCSAAGTITLTVNNSVMSAGDVVCIVRKGAGAVTVAAGAGVTITSANSFTSAGAQGAYCALVFESASIAYFVGDRA